MDTATVVGGSARTPDPLTYSSMMSSTSRPLSPSPLWFPALQDEYFAASAPAAMLEVDSLYTTTTTSPLSFSSLSSSSASAGGDRSWGSGAFSTTTSSRTLSASTVQGAVTTTTPKGSGGNEPSSSVVHIVGGLPPFLGKVEQDPADKDGAITVLLGRCTSHDTMTTAASTVYEPRDDDVPTGTAATTGADADESTMPPPPIPSPVNYSSSRRAHSMDSSSTSTRLHYPYPRQQRRSSRDSRRALSAQDWDSILSNVQLVPSSSGDDQDDETQVQAR